MVQSSNMPAAPTGSWGAEQASNKDLLIPKLHLMQDLSDQVKKGKARPGMIINSSTGEPVADTTTPVEIIPILTFNEWLLYDVIDDRGKRKEVYSGKVLVSKDNENWAKEDVVQGKLVTRVRQINVMALLPKYVDDLPFMLAFRKTSTLAGRKLSTHFQVSGMKNKPAAAQVFNLSAVSMTRENYSFYGFEVEPGRVTSEQELAKAYHWYQLFNRGSVKTAEEQDAEIPF
jgi:hypothetical protein